MLTLIVNSIFLGFILILFYGAALIVMDKEKAHTKRQALKAQADKYLLSQNKNKNKE